MENILLTGFRKFGDYKVNPTEQFLKNHDILGDFYLHSLIFPAHTFNLGAENFGTEVVRTAYAVDALAIISLGLASDVKGLRIESKAVNWSAGKYCLDFENEKTFLRNQSLSHSKRINLKHWNFEFMFKSFRSLDIKFEREISKNAGNFCCNALMYRTLSALGSAYKIPYIFLHIPCTKESVEGLNDFDRDKDLITLEELNDILTIVSMSLK